MLDGGIHPEPLRGGLLAGDDDVDIIAAAQAVVGHRQQCVGVRWQIDAHNLGFLWKPWYKGLDPEVTFNGINTTSADGGTFGWVRADYFTLPMLRRLTMAVDVSF